MGSRTSTKSDQSAGEFFEFQVQYTRQPWSLVRRTINFWNADSSDLQGRGSLWAFASFIRRCLDLRGPAIFRGGVGEGQVQDPRRSVEYHMTF